MAKKHYKYTTLNAVLEIIHCSMRHRRTKTGSRYAVDALMSLGLEGKDLIAALEALEICDESGNPFPPAEKTW